MEGNGKVYLLEITGDCSTPTEMADLHSAKKWVGEMDIASRNCKRENSVAGEAYLRRRCWPRCRRRGPVLFFAGEKYRWEKLSEESTPFRFSFPEPYDASSRRVTVAGASLKIRRPLHLIYSTHPPAYSASPIPATPASSPNSPIESQKSPPLAPDSPPETLPKADVGVFLPSTTLPPRFPMTFSTEAGFDVALMIPRDFFCEEQHGNDGVVRQRGMKKNRLAREWSMELLGSRVYDLVASGKKWLIREGRRKD
ncbi:hypothetical protein KSP40_PGU009085 [Platanthera guangdongensis]|uniref:Uncharacterized protein n=1 Tax=Platanthera guangdongensis TaxID=2320717 RepID=A0ABR2M6N2_9ASPA